MCNNAPERTVQRHARTLRAIYGVRAAVRNGDHWAAAQMGR